MGIEKAQFTRLDNRQFDHLKGLYNASRTIGINQTMDSVITGFKKGVKREFETEGLGEVAQDIEESSKDSGYFVVLFDNGKSKVCGEGKKKE